MAIDKEALRSASMRSKVAIIILLSCIIYCCNTESVDKDANKGKIVSSGYWVPDKVEEIKGLKTGPFIRLTDGSILTVDSNKSCISNDGAKTWSEYRIFSDTNKFNMAPPKLIIRTQSGEIIMAFVNLKEKANWNWQKDIHDSPGAILPNYVIRSFDGGKTWQDVQKLHDDWTGSIRDITETSDGSIVFTSMIMRHHPGHHTVLTYTSKDEGKTWTASSIIDMGGTGSHSHSNRILKN
ncbi:MAG TPA: sialidase family protein [Hanamia sp.]|nr:sialidase family protein [Hanamia sp.]